ncbi:MAG: heme-binding protein, partial [Betaproteobacteria bacterium]
MSGPVYEIQMTGVHGRGRSSPRDACISPAAVCCAIALAAMSFAASGADPNKVLHVALVAPETGFDPQAASDLYSNYVDREIFDPLYKYDYLARPYKVIANTAAALPDISADGLTWTIKLRPGIYFSDDPAFKGSKRELSAADYVYAWKRLIDPKLRSNNVQNAIAAAIKAGKFDYDAPLEGAQAIDRYTIRLKLNFPAYDLLADLTSAATAAVAREVVGAYGNASGWVMDNPVGTGPYLLKSWRRGQQIVLEANPNFRDERFPESAQSEDRALLAKMRGKKLPSVGRIEINIIEESNPRLLAF